jgi:hypothetical protein
MSVSIESEVRHDVDLKNRETEVRETRHRPDLLNSTVDSHKYPAGIAT